MIYCDRVLKLHLEENDCLWSRVPLELSNCIYCPYLRGTAIIEMTEKELEELKFRYTVDLSYEN